ncbi:SLAM family member 9-like [Leptodactylus fuscus]|uniref:SLAM family member 9-like n=1 Tax=Leptodactylus fuscus TaxID=238119 RepID=UPI003F4E46F6
MELPCILLYILITITCTAAGNGKLRRYEMYETIGSSFTFPAVNLTTETVYDIEKVSHIRILTYHGSENVRPPYKQRAEFYSSYGIFVLKNLTKDDTGTYRQIVNMEVVTNIYLHVIEPVNEPTLRKVNETVKGHECHVLLECTNHGKCPFNMTFLKDGEEVSKNITQMDYSSYLSLDVWAPGSSATYTCKLWSPLGDKTSGEVQLPSADDNICRNKTSLIWTMFLSIIFVIIGIIIITVGMVYIYKRRCAVSGDEESGEVTQEETSSLQHQETSNLQPQ